MLGYFGLEHGVTIHCVDLDPNSGSKGGQYEDVSLVQKYVMSDEDYDKRKGTLRAWGREQKAVDPSFTYTKHEREHRAKVEANRKAKLGEGCSAEGDDKAAEVSHDKESVRGMEIGMRCEVHPGGRRGSIQFIGEIPKLGSGGYWCGVRFDEPVGKADGPIKGKRYFEAEKGYGGFVRAKNVAVGDYPERSFEDELDSDSDDEL